MAYKEMREGGRYVASGYEFICDERDDVSGLPSISFGAAAYVIEDGSVWIQNSGGTWVEQPACGGSSGSGNSGSGGVLVCTVGDNDAIDHTWQEVYDADFAVITYEESGGYKEMYIVIGAVASSGSYTVDAAASTGDGGLTVITLTTNSASGHPVLPSTSVGTNS